MYVSQLDAVTCEVQYWYKWQNEHDRIKPKYIFVGDVHGDLNQFLYPLIDTGTITLTGKVNSIKQKYNEIDLHLPEYSCNECDTEIYYVGDLSDNYIFSRQIVVMLAYIMKQCKNVHLCIGNHDIIYMNHYDVKDITATTFSKHLQSLDFLASAYPTLSLYRYDLTCPGKDFLDEYFKPMLNAYHELWEMAEICMKLINRG